jgi:hypothetical protein
MRIAPELSKSRVNQAGWNGPLLLSEPISKNESKLTLRRQKWGTFYRKGYVGKYSATRLRLRCYDSFGKMGSWRQNATKLWDLMVCVQSQIFEIVENPEKRSKT